MFLCRFIYQIKRTWKMESKNKNGDYVIPDSVKNYDGEPLYILVSLGVNCRRNGFLAMILPKHSV